MDVLLRLQHWYAAQCDGDWEHQHSVCIDTLDNPGWLVKIDLAGTSLEGQLFLSVAEGVGPASHPVGSRWVHCAVQDWVWQGAGDESQLVRILSLFLDWASSRAADSAALDQSN
jgi:hypothetical protein